MAEDKSVSETPSNHVAPPANVLLNKFLEENNIEITILPYVVKSINDGGLVIEKAQAVANYKATPSSIQSN